MKEKASTDYLQEKLEIARRLYYKQLELETELQRDYPGVTIQITFRDVPIKKLDPGDLFKGGARLVAETRHGKQWLLTPTAIQLYNPTELAQTIIIYNT